MEKTIGHKASQPGLRGHSHDAEQDLMKQFVVARKLPTGGKLWVASFDQWQHAQTDIIDRAIKTASGIDEFEIIDQFNNDMTGEKK